MKSIVGLVAVTAGLLACSDASTGTGSGGAGGDAAGGNATSASGGAGGGLLPADAKTVTFGPVDVAAGVEKTQCVTKRLGNEGEFHVGQIHNELIGVSHHLIVYRVADTEERTVPYDCDPFTDTLDPAKGSPLMITQKKEEFLTLPPGVAFTLEPNQMVRLEMHYINASGADATIEGRSTFVPLREDAYKEEAGLLFAGSVDINIAPGSQDSVEAFIKTPADLTEKNYFGFTGHIHKHGTNVTVHLAKDKTDTGSPVYDVNNFTWSEPPTVYFDPPVVPPAGSGFRIKCDWNNTSTDTVQFGESANQEMCFFWAYYYPNAGSRVCFHTDQVAGGIDACCPGAGAICDQFGN